MMQLSALAILALADTIRPRSSHGTMIPKKPASDLIRGGKPRPEKIVLKQGAGP